MQVWFLFLLFITHCHAIFWCLFVDCDDKGRSNDGFIEVDQDWIQPENSEEILYHFPNEVNAMNWYEANDYCLDKGGYLAEPHNSEESGFLKNYASKFPNINHKVVYVFPVYEKDDIHHLNPPQPSVLRIVGLKNIT